jgi:hypothetical protein
VKIFQSFLNFNCKGYNRIFTTGLVNQIKRENGINSVFKLRVENSLPAGDRKEVIKPIQSLKRKRSREGKANSQLLEQEVGG